MIGSYGNPFQTSFLTNYTTNTSGTGSLMSTGVINVGQLVTQLMNAQSQPLTALQKQLSGIQTTLSAYGQLQSSVSSLQTAAQTLSSPSAFQAAQATVTGAGVAATVTGTPAPANYSVGVSSIAQAQSVFSSPVADPTALTMGTGTLTIQMGSLSGSTFTGSGSAINVSITSSNDSLNGIAAAINAAASGSMNASVVTDASGSRLVLSAANTGLSNAFSVTSTGASGSGLAGIAFNPASPASTPSSTAMGESQAAANANFTVNGLALSSASNTVTSAIQGVTLNLTQPTPSGSPAQVAIGSNVTAITNSVVSFLQAYNNYVSTNNTLTAYNSQTNTAAVLTGDPTAMQTSNSLQAIMSSATTAGGNSSYSYLAQIGVSFNSDGSLSLNTTQFQAALSANPSAVSAMFTQGGTGSGGGFAFQVASLATQLVGPTGAIGSAESSANNEVANLNSQISSEQTMLAQIKQNLIAQYSQLNANLVQAQQTQASLYTQLAALP